MKFTKSIESIWFLVISQLLGLISQTDLSLASYYFVFKPQNRLKSVREIGPCKAINICYRFGFFKIVGPTGLNRQILWRTGKKLWLSVLGPAGYFGLLFTFECTGHTDYRKDWQKVKLCSSYDLQKNTFWKVLFRLDKDIEKHHIKYYLMHPV